MRVGICARVSTQDKDQNPETQLLPLREFCRTQGWDVAGEYVDYASATDLRGRREWSRLLEAGVAPAPRGRRKLREWSGRVRHFGPADAVGE